MSIAVSTLVKPSRILLFIAGGFCGCVMAIGCAIVAGWIGDMPFPLKVVLAALCCISATVCLYVVLSDRIPVRIDISGAGQIRVVKNVAMNVDLENVEVLHLMADSTLWPGLLLLRLQAENGTVTVVRILPDSVSAPSFRALSVACRWIAAHRNPVQAIF